MTITEKPKAILSFFAFKGKLQVESSDSVKANNNKLDGHFLAQKKYFLSFWRLRSQLSDPAKTLKFYALELLSMPVNPHTQRWAYLAKVTCELFFNKLTFSDNIFIQNDRCFWNSLSFGLFIFYLYFVVLEITVKLRWNLRLDHPLIFSHQKVSRKNILCFVRISRKLLD